MPQTDQWTVFALSLDFNSNPILCSKIEFLFSQKQSAPAVSVQWKIAGKVKNVKCCDVRHVISQRCAFRNEVCGSIGLGTADPSGQAI
jgi:hypothetical protein